MRNGTLLSVMARHTAERMTSQGEFGRRGSDIEHAVQTLRASVKLLRPDIDVAIIRTDGAAENRSKE